MGLESEVASCDRLDAWLRQSWLYNMEALFRASLGVSIDSIYECQQRNFNYGPDEQWDPARWDLDLGSTLLIHVWSVVSIVLLLNMLIAAMTKSYDEVEERSNYW